MKRSILYVFLAGMALSNLSCKKEDSSGKLGGNTDLDLTKVGTETSIYVDAPGGNLPEMKMTVSDNNDGDVTYNVTVDFTGHPDSAVLVGLIPDRFLDAQNRFNFDIKMRITSEGYQDYVNDPNVPFTICRYEDPVGTTYTHKLSTGTTISRTITEKTGLDDWPYGWLLIKTTEVTQTSFSPEADAVFKTLKFRLNHRFGLVYLEAELENGMEGSASLYADI